jgi:hypothetical protein
MQLTLWRTVCKSLRLARRKVFRSAKASNGRLCGRRSAGDDLTSLLPDAGAGRAD